MCMFSVPTVLTYEQNTHMFTLVHYMYVRLCMYMNTCTSTWVDTSMHAWIHVWARTYIHTWIYVETHLIHVYHIDTYTHASTSQDTPRAREQRCGVSSYGKYIHAYIQHVSENWGRLDLVHRYSDYGAHAHVYPYIQTHAYISCKDIRSLGRNHA